MPIPPHLSLSCSLATYLRAPCSTVASKEATTPVSYQQASSPKSLSRATTPKMATNQRAHQSPLKPQATAPLNARPPTLPFLLLALALFRLAPGKWRPASGEALQGGSLPDDFRAYVCVRVCLVVPPVGRMSFLLFISHAKLETSRCHCYRVRSVPREDSKEILPSYKHSSSEHYNTNQTTTTT